MYVGLNVTTPMHQLFDYPVSCIKLKMCILNTTKWHTNVFKVNWLCGYWLITTDIFLFFYFRMCINLTRTVNSTLRLRCSTYIIFRSRLWWVYVNSECDCEIGENGAMENNLEACFCCTQFPFRKSPLNAPIETFWKKKKISI